MAGYFQLENGKLMQNERKFLIDKIKSENSEEIIAALRELLNLIDDEEIKDVVSNHCSDFTKVNTVETLAEYLHQINCNWNHIDGCSWQYESWDEPGNARNRYLDKARRILAEHNIGINEAHDYIEMYKGLTKILKS